MWPAGSFSQKLTTRTFLKRSTRLALGFGKRQENLEAAVNLPMAYYNFCWRRARPNEGQGRVLRWNSRPLRFTSLPSVLKTQPRHRLPVPSTLQPGEPSFSPLLSLPN